MSTSIGMMLILAFALSLLLSTGLLTDVLSRTSGITSTSAPAIAWQQEYEGIAGYVSNVIQTSDGGYAFMGTGYARYSFAPPSSVIYKVDSSGKVQWNKTLEHSRLSNIIQTSDEGYEISGRWEPPSTHFEFTPTIVKMDFQGNIQWVANYSSIFDLGINPTSIQTSDGGFAYLQFFTVSIYGSSGIPSGGIVKTDSNYNTQWVMNLTCPYPQRGPNGTFPLGLDSLIETSDGALAGLGVGRTIMSNRGHIYLIKTEPFLPLPQQTPLPTPILTPITPPTPTPAPTPNVEGIAIASVIFGMVAGAGLTVLLKKRKH